MSQAPSSKKSRQPRARVDALVIAGIREDELVRLQILVEHHLARLRAFHPEILRRLALASTASGFSGGRRFRSSSPTISFLYSAAIRREARTPCASAATRSVTAATVSGVARLLAVEALLDRAHQRRADHDAVGVAADGGGLLRRVYAETDRDR